jgi:hypothetical protein
MKLTNLLLWGVLALAWVCCLFGVAPDVLAQAITDPASTKIDFGPFIVNVVFPFAAAIVTVLVGWLSKRAATYFGLQNDALYRDALQGAMQHGLAYAQSRVVGAADAGSLTLDVKNQLIRTATQYALEHEPEAAKALGVDQASIVEKVTALLAINTTPPAQSAAVPTATADLPAAPAA